MSYDWLHPLGLGVSYLDVENPTIVSMKGNKMAGIREDDAMSLASKAGTKIKQLRKHAEKRRAIHAVQLEAELRQLKDKESEVVAALSDASRSVLVASGLIAQ